MVPNLAAGVWVGNEDRSAHFKGITYGQGATAALPIWGIFMKKCYGDETLQVSREPFERPANLQIKVDCYQAVRDTTSTDENEDIPIQEEQNTDEFEI
jgi:penicillin-binding protein 1A